jgi:hypothetical protein
MALDRSTLENLINREEQGLTVRLAVLSKTVVPGNGAAEEPYADSLDEAKRCSDSR